MSGRIFEMGETGAEPPPEAPKKPGQRPKRKPRNWRALGWIIFAVVAIGIIAAAGFSVWTLRRQIQALVPSLPVAAPLSSPTPGGKTKFEAFKLKYGSLTIKGYSIVGTVSGLGGNLTTQAVQLTDLTTKESAEAIVFVLKQTTGYLKNESSSVVDYDEIDSLLNGLDYVAKIDASVTPLQNFEALYRSRGGFQVGVYNDEQGKISAVLASGEITQVSVFIKLEDLPSFRSQVVAAQQKLASVRPAKK